MNENKQNSTSNSPGQNAFSCVATHTGSTHLPGKVMANGSLQLEFKADPGLYQFSVIADAKNFDWDSLYVVLNQWGNTGKRTGPWDFDPTRKNIPVLPSYWVELDGRRLGLWFFQRASVEDIAAKRLRGAMAFYINCAGVHVLSFIPYRPFELSWKAVTLETDPDDTLEPRDFNLCDWSGRCPAGRFADPCFWETLRDSMSTTHAVYREPISRMFSWLERRLLGEVSSSIKTLGFQSIGENMVTADILPLLAQYHLEGRSHALQAILAIVDNAIDQPHWGNPREDGYGHNGDMTAGQRLRDLAWALHALRDYLGSERRTRLIEKLRFQGKKFFDLILLHRDYWGGSVIQDHGKISLFAFGTAAIHLLGLLPEADLWTAYVLPRIRRNLRAIPQDGVIPHTSYGLLYLYLDEPSFYRDTLLALTGEDIYDQAPFHALVDFLSATLNVEKHQTITPIFGSLPFIGGNAALNQLAVKYNDGRAAGLQQLLLQTPVNSFFHDTQERGFYCGMLWGAFTHPKNIDPIEPLPRQTSLHWYEDSGQVHYYDASSDVTLGVACGPWCGYNAYRKTSGPCDHMEILEGSGHFILSVGVKTMLPPPDSGYRVSSAIRNVLLVDGQGHYGDIGYTMSIPSFRHRGESIVLARWDEAKRTGLIRLDLAPAYPEALGIAFYTRDFIIEEGRWIVCRDRVVFDQPRNLAWLFHGFRDEGVIREDESTARFGSNPCVKIAAQPVGVALNLKVCESDVVFSYASYQGRRHFDHARFESATPVMTATVDFIINWKGNNLL